MDEINSTPTKRCTKCGETKPADTEHFHARNRSPDGLRSVCKRCRAEEYAANPEPGREYARKRYEKDPAALRAAIAAWRMENPEKVREMNRSWYLRNTEKREAYNAAWRAENPEKAKSASRQRGKKYYLKNKDKDREKTATRRARKAGAGGGLSRGIRKRLFLAQEGRCAYCRVELGESAHLDHIIPLSKGGAHSDGNVQLLCPQCNLSKGAKMPEEFIKYREAHA